MSAAGNDFVIVDARKDNYQFTASLITKISKRNNIGCDQFILLKNSSKADILMEIYNSDGSTSAACGNATRCVAKILMEEKSVDKVTIETAAGILPSWKDGNLIAVDMGKPKFDWQEIPLLTQQNTEDFVVDQNIKYHFSAVNMGNPHIVSFIDQDLSDKEFFEIAPKLETHNIFPQKTNIEFAQILSPTHIKVRVWERGAGETLACGSGACAVAVAAIRKSLVEKAKLKITFKGGDLFIQWFENNQVIMSGDCQKIFNGVFDESFI
ncbi:MAG: dapF [Rickettsiaceae bacterium]|nr:dapF [Rickettsiaceae bacterium]